LNILNDEFTMSMRLIGARNLVEIVPEMVDASNIGCHIVSVPGDGLYNSNCKPGFYLVSMFGPELNALLSSDVDMQHARLRETPPAAKL
jgi:L-lactate dehydrogenase (cytochrome)